MPAHLINCLTSILAKKRIQRVCSAVHAGWEISVSASSRLVVVFGKLAKPSYAAGWICMCDDSQHPQPISCIYRSLVECCCLFIWRYVPLRRRRVWDRARVCWSPPSPLKNTSASRLYPRKKTRYLFVIPVNSCPAMFSNIKVKKKSYENCQLLSFEKSWMLNISILQDDLNEWSQCSIWAAGSKVRTNNTKQFYSSRRYKWMVAV